MHKAFIPSIMYSESYLLFNMKHDTVRGFFGRHNHMHQYVKLKAFPPLTYLTKGIWSKDKNEQFE